MDLLENDFTHAVYIPGKKRKLKFSMETTNPSFSIPRTIDDIRLQELLSCSDELVRHYVSTNKTPPEILIALRVRLRMIHHDVKRLRRM